MNNKDVFEISAKSQIKKASSLMNRAGKAYWSLKDRNTKYAKSLYACYFMMKRIIETIDDVVREYSRNEIKYPSQDE